MTNNEINLIDGEVARASSIGVFADSLINLTTGMGTDKDNLVGTHFVQPMIDEAQLSAAYRGDWIARKCVDIPADDATREWRSWQLDSSDISKIEEVEKQFSLQSKLCRALKFARLYGGGALILGVDQGLPEEELRIDAIKPGALKFVHAVSRYSISNGPMITDIMSPYFGQPEYYMRTTRVNGRDMTINIHPSRVIPLIGNELPDAEREQDVWGDSVLVAVANAIKSAGITSNSVAQLISDSKIDVVKLPEMSLQMENREYESRLRQRFAMANQIKSIYSLLLIDKEEEWQRITQSLDGYDALLKMYLLIACGAVDIPATRFLGQSPTGLSATGESDVRNYYDNIGAIQKNDITPTIARLDEIIVRSALGDYPDGTFYIWNPLWQMTDEQKADISKKKADTFKIDLDSGLFDPALLRKARENQLIEDGVYPGFEQIIEEFGEEEFEPNNKPSPDEPNGDPDAEAEDPFANDAKRKRDKRRADYFVWEDDDLVPLKKQTKDFNPYHEPAGSSIGGQFTSAPGGGDIDPEESRKRREKADRGIAVPSDSEQKKMLDDSVEDQLTGGEKDAVISYSGTSYRFVNRSLRGSGEVPAGFEEQIKQVSDGLDKAFNRTSLSQDVITYRGLSAKRVNELRAAPDGMEFTDKGFVSTSLNKFNAESFSDVGSSIPVFLPKGSKALPLDGLAQHQEYEVLVNRGSVFVKRTDSKGNAYLELRVARDNRDAAIDDTEHSVKPLYVSRKVRNADAIIKWAKANGFKTTLPADELHVTVIYSRAAVDWTKMPDESWVAEQDGGMRIKPGGMRIIEKFGDAYVLLFTSSDLQYRHFRLKEAGCSHDFDYQPHLTLSYEGGPADLDNAPAYTGEIILGPEVFEPINENYREGIVEDAIARFIGR